MDTFLGWKKHSSRICYFALACWLMLSKIQCWETRHAQWKCKDMRKPERIYGYYSSINLTDNITASFSWLQARNTAMLSRPYIILQNLILLWGRDFLCYVCMVFCRQSCNVPHSSLGWSSCSTGRAQLSPFPSAEDLSSYQDNTSGALLLWLLHRESSLMSAQGVQKTGKVGYWGCLICLQYRKL